MAFAPRAAAITRCIHEALDGGAVGEVRAHRRAAGDGGDPLAGHCLLRAEDVAVGVVHRVAARFLPDFVGDGQFVQRSISGARPADALLAGPIHPRMQRAAIAVQVEFVDLAEGRGFAGDGGGVEQPLRAAGELQHDHGVVVGLHVRFAGRVAGRAFDQPPQFGGDGRDVAEEPPGQVEKVRGDVAQRAGARDPFVEAPVVAAGATKACEVAEVQMKRAPDVAVVKQPFQIARRPACSGR